MQFIINPGIGPVDNATEQHATTNMEHFVTDCSAKNLKFVRLTYLDDRGRFGFLLYRDTRCHTIEMPGLPLEKVRYMGPEQDIWDFPRLYVDGSSWVWCYALLDDDAFKEVDA